MTDTPVSRRQAHDNASAIRGYVCALRGKRRLTLEENAAVRELGVAIGQHPEGGENAELSPAARRLFQEISDAHYQTIRKSQVRASLAEEEITDD